MLVCSGTTNLYQLFAELWKHPLLQVMLLFRAGSFFLEQARKLVKQLSLVIFIVLKISISLLISVHSSLSHTNSWGYCGLFDLGFCYWQVGFFTLGRQEFIEISFHFVCFAPIHT